jgi:hypothetical protein
MVRFKWEIFSRNLKPGVIICPALNKNTERRIFMKDNNNQGGQNRGRQQNGEGQQNKKNRQEDRSSSMRNESGGQQGRDQEKY